MSDHEFPADVPSARFSIAGRSFRSRLMLGTGKYRTPEIMAACHRESGAEIITVAVRRVNLGDRGQDSILSLQPDPECVLQVTGSRLRRLGSVNRIRSGNGNE